MDNNTDNIQHFQPKYSEMNQLYLKRVAQACTQRTCAMSSLDDCFHKGATWGVLLSVIPKFHVISANSPQL